MVLLAAKPSGMSDRRCLECWKAYDRTDRGYSNKKQLPKLMRDLEIPISRTEIAQLFRECNCEDTDQIDFIAFRQYYRVKKMKHRAMEDTTLNSQQTMRKRVCCDELWLGTLSVALHIPLRVKQLCITLPKVVLQCRKSISIYRKSH